MPNNVTYELHQEWYCYHHRRGFTYYHTVHILPENNIEQQPQVVAQTPESFEEYKNSEDSATIFDELKSGLYRDLSLVHVCCKELRQHVCSHFPWLVRESNIFL